MLFSFSNLSDEVLVERIRSPESRAVYDGACQELYNRSRDDIYRIARRRSRGRMQVADIDNLVQVVWENVLASLKRYDSRKPFRPWLRKIIGRRQCDWYLKLKRDRRWIRLLDDVGEPICTSDDFAAVDFADEVKHFRSHLDLKLRRYFDAFVQCGGDVRSVAARLGVALCSVRRNRNKLRQRLAAYRECLGEERRLNSKKD